jgi:hypothetical protein
MHYTIILELTLELILEFLLDDRGLLRKISVWSGVTKYIFRALRSNLLSAHDPASPVAEQHGSGFTKRRRLKLFSLLKNTTSFEVVFFALCEELLALARTHFETT